MPLILWFSLALNRESSGLTAPDNKASAQRIALVDLQNVLNEEDSIMALGKT
jgi:hypothetical protein